MTAMPASEEAKASGPTVAARRCLVTGEVCERERLVRFVVDPAGCIVPDLDEKLPGRGLWVRASAPLIAKAATSGAFARAAERSIAVDAEFLVRQVEFLIVRRCQSLLGLAKRAAEAVNGYEKVAAWIGAGRAAVWVVASDAAAGSRAKIAPPAAVATVAWLTRDELSLAMGAENVVHAALSAGGLARRFLKEAARLAGIRDTGSASGASTAAAVNTNLGYCLVDV